MQEGIQTLRSAFSQEKFGATMETFAPLVALATLRLGHSTLGTRHFLILNSISIPYPSLIHSFSIFYPPSSLPPQHWLRFQDTSFRSEGSLLFRGSGICAICCVPCPAGDSYFSCQHHTRSHLLLVIYSLIFAACPCCFLPSKCSLLLATSAALPPLCITSIINSWLESAEEQLDGPALHPQAT